MDTDTKDTFTGEPVAVIILTTDRRDGVKGATKALVDAGIRVKGVASDAHHDSDGWKVDLRLAVPAAADVLGPAMEKAGFEYLWETTVGLIGGAEARSDHGISAYWSSVRCCVDGCTNGAASAWKVKGGDSFGYCAATGHEAEAKKRAQGTVAEGRSAMADVFGADGRWARRGRGDGAWTRTQGTLVVHATQTKANEVTVQVVARGGREDMTMRGRLASPQAALLYGNEAAAMGGPNR